LIICALATVSFFTHSSHALASQSEPLDSNQKLHTYVQEALKALEAKGPVYVKIGSLDEQEQEAIYQELRGQLQRPLELWRLILLDYPHLRLLRNEIYAQHGRTFTSADLVSYFTPQSWYKPDPGFTEASLTAVEKGNIDALARVEFVKYHNHEKLGEQIQFPNEGEGSVSLPDMGISITRNYTGC
jgi:hypothetical protein